VNATEGAPNLLRSITLRAARIHGALPLGVALALAFLSAELTLWVAGRFLLYFWRFFGWISGNDSQRLSAYNVLAHLVAFIVAYLIVTAMRPMSHDE
jgi:hypothetical protein